MFFKGDPYTGIDLDHLDAFPDATEIIKRASSYAEVSPSGKGYHIIVKGKPSQTIKKECLEVYGWDRFFTVTGNHLEGTPYLINDAQWLLDELVSKYGDKTKLVATTRVTQGSWENHVNNKGYTLLEIRAKDRVLDEYLRGGLAGKPSDSEADMGTLERLLFWGYTSEEAVAILSTYRYRDKLNRQDYIVGMLRKLLPLKETVKPKVAKQSEESEPAVLCHLNLIEDPSLAGVPVIVEAVVSSTSLAYLAPSELEATFEDKDGQTQKLQQKIDSKNPVNIQLVGINEGIKYRRLKRVLGLSLNINVQEKSFRTVYRVRVRPPVFTLERRGEKLIDERGFEYKCFDIYVTADRPIVFQPSTLIRLLGVPVPSPKTQQTTLLAYHVEFPEETMSFSIDKIKPLKETFKALTVRQRLDWLLDNFERFSQIVGRRNLATAGLLCYFTPVWIKFNGEVQRGWGNILFCGDTTTAKTETLRKLIRLLGAGMLVTAETASTVGLTGTATQVEREGWFVDWGFLVLLDRKLLCVDGAHKLSLSNWAALAEAERSGVVAIAKAAKNTAYARTRQIKVANPVDREADKYTTKSLGGFLYPCQALPTILDKTSIARLDLAVFADQRDVSPEQLNKAQSETYNSTLLCLSEALKWCWSQAAEVEFTEEAVDEIFTHATNLYKTFFCEEIPLATIDLKWKIARLSAALAYLTLSTEDYRKVTVTKEHVQVIADFITQEYSKAGLNTLAQTLRHEALDLDDAQALLAKIEKDINSAVDRATICQILAYVVMRGRVTRDELMTKFSLTEKNQVRPLIASLKGEDLIKVSRGFYPEPKLIQAYKVTGGFNLC